MGTVVVLKNIITKSNKSNHQHINIVNTTTTTTPPFIYLLLVQAFGSWSIFAVTTMLFLRSSEYPAVRYQANVSFLSELQHNRPFSIPCSLSPRMSFPHPTETNSWFSLFSGQVPESTVKQAMELKWSQKLQRKNNTAH